MPFGLNIPLKEKTRKIFLALLSVLLIATLAFIFTHSLASRDDSQAESEGVMDIITPFLEIFVGKGNVTLHLVRKLAHIFEFTVLGAELCFITVLADCKNCIAALFSGLLTALGDETVQIFSDRGSQVQDVWIDFSGVVLGTVGATAAGVVIALIYKKRKAKGISENE